MVGNIPVRHTKLPPTALATMPAIANTGAILFTGHKDTSGTSALVRRTDSSTRIAKTAVRRQVSVGNKSVENLAEREGFEPSVQVLARTTV